ncbi:MAG: LLM class F420-dependent oxidoreductase [Gammaproteobacteria bacterium]|nr:LLM class F420-dependent oxidoreductase [Gammaproteobacteria bacterium]
MDFGLTLPTRGPLGSPECIAALATRAEELGFAHLAAPDHIIVPKLIDSTYPYSASGEWPGQASGDCFDQFSVLSYAAAITSKPRLVTSVTVIPHRGAVETAKLVSTIDVLSHGRMTLGVGAGWLQEEFEAVGAPPFAKRGRVTNEYLEACKILWTEDDPRYNGEYVSFANISFLPKPVQQPHPPIWVGGESPAALRRTVRYGDAWYPIGNNPRHLLDTRERFADGVRRLHALAQENDRDPDTITLTYFSNWFDETRTADTDSGQRMLLTGSAGQIAEDIGALGEFGVRHLVLNFQRETLERSLDSMQHFADVIRPLV